MEIPTFSPTMKEFENFEEYMKNLVKNDSVKVGLARIIPPKQWLDEVELTRKDVTKVHIKCPVRQVVSGKEGIYKISNNLETSKISYLKFKDLALEQEGKCAKYLDHVNRNSFEDVSRKFWDNLLKGESSMYGADSPGSLFDDSLKIWNLNKLPSILRVIGVEISGVTHSYLYFGMWKALFAAHTEDMELFSINFLHDGAPKFWYAVPPESASFFEKVAEQLFPTDSKKCSEWLRHKCYLLDPAVLKSNNVPFCCGTQRKGEFIVTFPRAYHWGFNSGLNVAEAVNFALDFWIPYGKEAGYCSCRGDSVKIDMEHFLYFYLKKLRETGQLPQIAQNAEWRFCCPCGMEVSSDDPEFLWPRKPQFQCEKCNLWVHMECHGGLPDPPFCETCQRQDGMNPQNKKICL